MQGVGLTRLLRQNLPINDFGLFALAVALQAHRPLHRLLVGDRSWRGALRQRLGSRGNADSLTWVTDDNSVRQKSW